MAACAPLRFGQFACGHCVQECFLYARLCSGIRLALCFIVSELDELIASRLSAFRFDLKGRRWDLRRFRRN